MCTCVPTTTRRAACCIRTRYSRTSRTIRLTLRHCCLPGRRVRSIVAVAGAADLSTYTTSTVARASTITIVFRTQLTTALTSQTSVTCRRRGRTRTAASAVISSTY